MDENSYNLSDLFKSPFGPNHPRNWKRFGPLDIIPLMPKQYKPIIPMDYYTPIRGSPYQREQMKKQKEKKEIKETLCQCGKAMQPITVEISFKLKDPQVIYVGDIFLEYCPDCQDEQLLAHACKNASHKFLTNLTQNKK